MLFSRRYVSMAADVDFISISRNGQLTRFCHGLANFIWKLREHTCATLKRNIRVLFSSPACSILASEVDLICLARNSHFTGFCHALSCTKTRNTGTPEHRNTGTPEHRNTETLWNTPKQPRAPRNTGTAKKHWNTEFDEVVLISHYRPCKKSENVNVISLPT